MKSIYSYTSHLEFLNDRYNKLKASDYYFSHRKISELLGYKSSSTFLKMLGGKIEFSNELLNKVCKVFQLHTEEAAYFKILTYLNQSKLFSDKILNLNNLIRFIKSHLDVITKEQFRFFLRGCYIPFLSVISSETFQEEYRDLLEVIEEPFKEYEIDKIKVLMEKYFSKQESKKYSDLLGIITSNKKLRKSINISSNDFHTIPFFGTDNTKSRRNTGEISYAFFNISEETYLSVQKELKISRQNIEKIVKEYNECAKQS